eukprot:maker-scaffold_1-snap-gene-12.34-mRNA-1 protein AED:0.01 eAED:0.01 QI:46/1/1/1/1/1/2/91/596
MNTNFDLNDTIGARSTASGPSIHTKTSNTNSLLFPPPTNSFSQLPGVGRLKKKHGLRTNSITSVTSNRSNFSFMSTASRLQRTGSFISNFLPKGKGGATQADLILTNILGKMKIRSRPAVILCEAEIIEQMNSRQKSISKIPKVSKKMKHIYMKNILPNENRVKGKKYGQDALSICKYKNIECIVLCDGHGYDGTHIAQAISVVLSFRLVLKLRDKKKGSSLNKQEIYELFGEVEESVVYKSAATSELDIGTVVYYKYKGNKKKGTVVNFIEEEPKVTVVFESGEREVIFEYELYVERYSGGCTCIVFFTDKSSSVGRVCYLGDSRLMILNEVNFVQEEEPPKKEVIRSEIPSMRNSSVFAQVKKIKKKKSGTLNRRYKPTQTPVKRKTGIKQAANPLVRAGTLIRESSKMLDFRVSGRNTTGSALFKSFDPENDDVLDKVFGSEEEVGYFSQIHNVFSNIELARLKHFNGSERYVDRVLGRLVYENTSIEPTKGFGDVNMKNVGYSSTPDVSAMFKLTSGNLIVGASDGLFNTGLWSDDVEILDFIATTYEQHEFDDNVARLVGEVLVSETMSRLKKRVDVPPDDLSIFVYCVKH